MSRLTKGIILILFIISSMTACTAARNKEGKLVKRHFGYIEFVVPNELGGEDPVQILDVRSTGLWLDIDKRDLSKRIGSSFGIGYQHEKLNIVPEGCHVIFYLQSKEQISYAIELLETSSYREEDICFIQN